MGVTSSITRLLDPYDRQARLYPALLAISPVVLVAGCLYGAHSSPLTTGAAILASFGFLFWMANLARDRGKTLEPSLFAEWGGKPSIQLLQHSDSRIDPVTKQRYHAALSTRMGIAFPTPEREASEKLEASTVYESATRWLLEHTRDARSHALLFKENIAYGFRRNMLGLKPLGLSIGSGAVLWAAIASEAVSISASSLQFASPMALPANQVVAVAGSVLLTLMWLVGVTKERVRIAAFAYAERLLAACESLDQPRPAAKGRKKSKI